MVQQIEDLLEHWLPLADDAWVLAVITHIQGSSYRKPGAMMLFHEFGQGAGILSGGCLEADLRRHAQQAMQSQQIACVTYDATDESDASYRLGCGGKVDIMLIPLLKENHDLGLVDIVQAFRKGQSGYYQLPLAPAGSDARSYAAQFYPAKSAPFPTADFPKAGILSQSDGEALIIPLRPRFHLGIFGGGIDAKPVAAIAHSLGWQVSVFDTRTAYARSADFPHAHIVKQSANEASTLVASLDCAVVMHHNLNLDAAALKAIQPFELKYVALLGPAHRRDKVLEMAELSTDSFSGFFSAPAGLALGGELPSAIALSILAQCHGVLHGAPCSILDGIMP
ncbi:XdhC family protein [Shewanella seohaensis]|uniref:XdhC family protein n=1 Tax=Shewanella seohaensis TaxID=755175 RepID=UPI00200D6C32|nr:XdhC/CoxI family protein [Shewanella seohaensis]MCL1122367.1 XdhC family protein [Shewanella seohaensis]UXM81264.1 XdhC family protein [Shewanella seohaensis]